jgi:hypothetical protein
VHHPRPGGAHDEEVNGHLDIECVEAEHAAERGVEDGLVGKVVAVGKDVPGECGMTEDAEDDERRPLDEAHNLGGVPEEEGEVEGVEED